MKLKKRSEHLNKTIALINIESNSKTPNSWNIKEIPKRIFSNATKRLNNSIVK